LREKKRGGDIFFSRPSRAFNFLLFVFADYFNFEKFFKIFSIEAKIRLEI